MNLLPWIVGAGVYFLIRGGQKLTAAKSLRFDINQLPGVQISGGNAIITFKLIASNTTNEVFSIKNIYTRILVNGSFVGDITSTAPFTIPAQGSAEIPLSTTIGLSNALLSLATALTNRTGTATLTFQGSVATNSLTFPVLIEKKI